MFFFFILFSHCDENCPDLNNQTFTGIIGYHILNCDNNILRISNSNFLSCYSPTQGGAICLKQLTQSSFISNCMFVSCNSTSDAGALYLFSSSNTLKYSCFSYCKAKNHQSAQIITDTTGVIDINYISLYSLGHSSFSQVSSFSTAAMAQHIINYLNNTGSSVAAQGAGIEITNCQNLHSSYNTFFNNSGSNIIYYFFGLPSKPTSIQSSTNSPSLRRSNIYQCITTGVGIIFFNNELNIDECVFCNNTGYPYIGFNSVKYPDVYLHIYDSYFDVDSAGLIHDQIILQNCRFGDLYPLNVVPNNTYAVCPNKDDFIQYSSQSNGLHGSQIFVTVMVSLIGAPIVIAVVVLYIRSKMYPENNDSTPILQ